MNDLLIEVLTEEIPHNVLNSGSKSFTKVMTDFLIEHALLTKDALQGVTSYATPRRLALLVKDVAEKQEDVVVEQRGPFYAAACKDGQPTKAGEGFFRSQGFNPALIPTLTKEEVFDAPFLREVKGKEYIFVKRMQEGRLAKDLLTDHFVAILSKVNFPKKMRWGDNDFSFVRPIRGITIMLGADVIDVSIAGVVSSNTLVGHRILSEGSATLTEPALYEETLTGMHVIPSKDARLDEIYRQLVAIEAKTGLTACEKERVANMVVNLVERPFLVDATFDKAFLEVPEEVLTSEMIEHQMYFPMRGADGKLTNTFVITANQEETEYIRGGNVRVLTARLSDGTFLYQEDLKRGLTAMTSALSTLLFRKELGSMEAKVSRMLSHGNVFKEILSLDEATAKDVDSTLSLMKGDLVSNMVFEFAELQGIMGGYFAKAEGHSDDVALAIREHYKPTGASDSVPTTLVGRVASVIDKLDNIIAGFFVGDIPTGSQDPQALRRQALGIIKIVLDAAWHVDMEAVVTRALAHFPSEARKEEPGVIIEQVLSFMKTRFEVYLRDTFSYDAVRGVLSLGLRDIYDSYLKIAAVDTFRNENEETFAALITVFKRATNIIGENTDTSVDAALLTEDAERALFTFYCERKETVALLVTARAYGKAFAELAAFFKPLDTFFTDVLVMADDEKVKRNRINLLTAIDTLFQTMLAFKEIVS